MRILSLLLTSFFAVTPFLNAAPLDQLKEGNARFARGEAKCKNVTIEDRKSLAQSQQPIATIVMCSDSRVSPELIFDLPQGRIFVVRLAGNIIDQFALGSIEYAVSVLKTPLIVILGHQNCGAVAAAFTLNQAEYSANVGSLLNEIWPAAKMANEKSPNASDAEKLDLAIKYNVVLTHRSMLRRSPIIRKYIDSGQANVVEGVFNIGTGEVDWDLKL